MEGYADWVMAISSVVTAGVTFALVYYAYATIKESMRDRRKDLIEKKLEKVYTPLYDTLLGAREKGRKTHGPSTWDLSVTELEEIKKIMRDYGHLFQSKQDLDTFRVMIRDRGTEEPVHGNSWLFEEADMGPVFNKIIDGRRETLTRELGELTKPPGSPRATNGEGPAYRQEHSAPQASSELASGVTSKSRLQRYDEMFRTLLVIATVLLAIHLAAKSPKDLPGIIVWVTLLVLAAIVWSLATLSEKHPRASSERVLSLGMLTIYFVALVLQLFVDFPLTNLFKFLEGRCPACDTVISLVMGVPSHNFFELRLVLMVLFSPSVAFLGGKYLQLKCREMILALSLCVAFLVVVGFITGFESGR